MKSKELKELIKSYSNKEQAKILQRYFKTGKGEYGEGYIFIGLKQPEINECSKQFLQTYLIKGKLKENITIDEILIEINEIINDSIHDIRSTGCSILLELNKINPESIYRFYIQHLECFNNWDLVDKTCYKIMGSYLFTKKKDILYELSKSENIWKRRISIISTLFFIKNKSYSDAFKIIEILKFDSHDLIKKAVGWMLREIGKMNEKKLIHYLEKNYSSLSSITRNYACEKLSKEMKKKLKEMNMIYFL